MIRVHSRLPFGIALHLGKKRLRNNGITPFMSTSLMSVGSINLEDTQHINGNTGL
jgi:hypothetical protein